jgi:hypothetical protein
MLFSRAQLLYASLAVAEAAWMFAFASIVGAMVGLGESPLPALVILAVIVLAMSAAWVAGDLGDDIVTLALLQGVAGLIIVYGAVAFKMVEGSPTFDGLWFVRLLSGEYGQPEILGIIAGFLIAMFLWRRGILLVARGEAWETLHRTFRIGIAIISIALIVDISTETDIGVAIVIFPFFVASLAGMAIGRVAEEGAWDSASAIWGRVIIAVVGGVVAVGVVLGALGAAFGSGPLGLIVSLIVAIRDGMFWVLEIILTPPLTLFFWFIQWLRDRFGDPISETAVQGNVIEEGLLVEGSQAAEAVGGNLIDTIIGIIVWPVGFILLLIVLWILIKSFQRLVGEKKKETDSDRESIRGDADARSDLANLLGRLIPGFLKNQGEEEEGLRFPSDQPGITEVFKLYFRLLTVGLSRGAVLESHLTPAEIEGRLGVALPGAQVDQITRRFEAACYGHEPTAAALLNSLTSSLDEAESRPEPEGD